MSKRKAQIEECDNPQCHYLEVVERDGEPATGYHLGRGVWIHGGGGGPIPATYACSVGCIAPAIEYMTEGNNR